MEADAEKLAQVQGGSSFESMKKEYSDTMKNIMPGQAQAALVNKGILIMYSRILFNFGLQSIVFREAPI